MFEHKVNFCIFEKFLAIMHILFMYCRVFVNKDNEVI